MFTQKEQEIISFGSQNGKSRQEVEQAISNYRNGTIPQKAVQQPEASPSLSSKLVGRAKDLGKEALSFGTFGASTLTPQDVAEGKQSPQQGSLVALQAFNRAFQSPIRAAGAVAGAGVDIISAGMDASGITEAIAPIVKPIAESGVVQAGVKQFKRLPTDTQEVLGDVANVAAFTPIGLAGRLPKFAIPDGKSAFDLIRKSQGGMTNKALDFISADPSAKVETILKRTMPEELDNYLMVAEKSSVSGEAKSVFETVGDKMYGAARELKTKLDGIGKAKSEVMARSGNVNFTKQTAPMVAKLQAMRASVSEVNKGDAGILDALIADAKSVKTAQQADVFIDKAQDALYTGGVNMTIPKGSSLEKQLRKVVGEYNTALKVAVPEEYATLNTQYADLVGNLNVLNRGLGEVIDGTPIRGAGLIKQYFSPASSKTKELFEFVLKETDGRIDLAKDATLAKFAGQLFDDANVNSLLGGIKDIPTSLSQVIGKVAEKVGGKKVEEALRKSTIRKAEGITTPRSESGSSLETPTPELLKVSPQTKPTPTPTKSKGIKGFIDFSEMLPKKKVSNNSAQEAIAKGMTEDEFVNAQPIKKTELTGSMGHRPSFEDMPPVHNLLEGGMLPKDVYTQPDFSIGNGAIRRGEKAANESWEALKKIKGKPDAEITIYRASPKNELRNGDWVSLSKEYARQESLSEGVKVNNFKVKAKDVIFAGDDINEFGYWGHSSENISQLRAEYQAALKASKK